MLAPKQYFVIIQFVILDLDYQAKDLSRYEARLKHFNLDRETTMLGI